MITLVAATNNPHKIIEFREILGKNFDVKSLKDLGLKVEVEEDADSFYGNAYKKAKAVSDASGFAALADDSGLIVDALGGAPGVYSARYAGTDGDDEANRKKLLKEMAGVTDFGKRTARFHSSVVIVYPDGTSIAGAGDTEGKILFEEKGAGGFGYDCLFYSEDLGKSFGEATPEEKNSVSHRSRALYDILASEIKG